MPKLDSPLQLQPVFKPKIWGRKNLDPLFSPTAGGTRREASLHDDPDNSELIGEVWITDDTARFLNGPVAGLTLGEASRKYGPELHGRAWKDPRFPILAKYLFTDDWLSVQVHPDDDFARIHDPGNPGKCEMWYILHVDRRAEVLLGVKPAVDKKRLMAAFHEGTSRELLNRFHPNSDEAVFVPPGAVHALGPGLVLFEAEQNSDLTYRLDDFGRAGLDGKPRPLHWDKGLEVIRAELPARRNLPRLEFREPYGSHRFVLACRFFALEDLTLRKLAAFEGRAERVEILSVLAGEGRVETSAGWLAYRAGDTWLIPPATGEYRLVPGIKTRLLKTYVPDIDRDFRRALAKRGVGAAKINPVVIE